MIPGFNIPGQSVIVKYAGGDEKLFIVTYYSITHGVVIGLLFPDDHPPFKDVVPELRTLTSVLAEAESWTWKTK